MCQNCHYDKRKHNEPVLGGARNLELKQLDALMWRGAGLWGRIGRFSVHVYPRYIVDKVYVIIDI